MSLITDIATTIRSILVNEFSIDTNACKEQANLVTDLDLDSLEIAELAIRLEETFGIELHDEDFRKAQTVGDMVLLIQGKKTQ